MSTETNCFRIDGLDGLSTTYRLYQITGLRRDGPDYYSNVQRLVRRLSFQMRAPVTTYACGGRDLLRRPHRGRRPARSHYACRGIAVLKDAGDVIDLDFTEAHPELNPVRLRFLQFIFSGSALEGFASLAARSGAAVLF